MKIQELKKNIDQAQNNSELWTAIWNIFDYLKSIQPTEKYKTNYIKQTKICECKDPIIMPFSKIKQCSKCWWKVS